MSMSNGSFRRVMFVVNSLYTKKGGHCSFYCRFLIKSRFLYNFGTKNRVVFDTTDENGEVEKMGKLKYKVGWQSIPYHIAYVLP